MQPDPPSTNIQPDPPAARPGATRERWPEDLEELPARPRRRLLAPLPVALLTVLAIACGFIGGVLVQKRQDSASAPLAGAASASSPARLASLGRVSPSAGASGAGFARAGGGAVTIGQVAFVDGPALYVSDFQGNTVEILTSKASKLTRAVGVRVSSIHPGETVTVRGTTGARGVVSAESIAVGASAGSLGGLFGGGASPGTGRTGASGEGGPALFGRGG